jgi:hypothetical protein
MVHERSAVSTSLEVDNTRKESSPGNDGLELHSDPFVDAWTFRFDEERRT